MACKTQMMASTDYINYSKTQNIFSLSEFSVGIRSEEEKRKKIKIKAQKETW